MAEEININSREELEAWLKNKPAEWSQIIALRAALRVFPFVTSVIEHRIIPKNQKQGLILQAWRAMFISSVARKYPTDDMMRAANAAANAAEAANAANAANASRAAVFAAFAAFAASDAAGAAASAASRAAYAAGAAVWAAISRDCRLLADLGTDGLMKRDIWEPEKQGVEGKTQHGPDWIWEWTRQLADLQNIFGSSWALITSWYFAHASRLSSGNEKFWLSKDAVTLALKPDDFWKITDDRTADQILDECAQVLGWGGANETPARAEPATNDAKKGDTAISPKIIARNRTAIRLQIVGLENTVSMEREMLGAKPNEHQRLADWESKSAFLSKFENGLNQLTNSIAETPDGEEAQSDNLTASLLQQLAAEFGDWLNKNRPEMVDWTVRLGSASGFVGLLAFLGANMPIATSVILLMTCGKSARDAILGVKKIKD